MNSSAELRDCMRGFLLANANDYPDDMYENNRNPETGKYEMFIISQEVMDSLGKIEFIEPTFYFNSYVVSKEVYNTAYEKYMSQFTDVTDTTEYSTDWISSADDVNAEEILAMIK